MSWPTTAASHKTSGVPSITGRVEISLTVRDPAHSAAWYAELLGMRQRYDFTADDSGMRYICLVEPKSGFVLCLVGHASNPGEPQRVSHRARSPRVRRGATRRPPRLGGTLDELGIAHSGVKELSYTENSMLTFRDPDNIQLEFFWRAPGVD
jgi:glyoxylase I family protein